MKALNLFSVFFFTCILVSSSYATIDEERDYRFRPCDYWGYSTAAKGWTCVNLGTPTTFVTAKELEASNKKIAELERKVSELEKRLSDQLLD